MSFEMPQAEKSHDTNFSGTIENAPFELEETGSRLETMPEDFSQVNLGVGGPGVTAYVWKNDLDRLKTRSAFPATIEVWFDDATKRRPDIPENFVHCNFGVLLENKTEEGFGAYIDSKDVERVKSAFKEET